MSKGTDTIYVKREFTNTQIIRGDREIISESPSFRNAIAVWHMSSLDDTAGGNSFLTAYGDIKIGAELTGIERESSIKHGGDGYYAHFQGGYLDAGIGYKGELNIEGKKMSLCVRLKDLSEIWNASIISKYGINNRSIYRLYTTDILLIFELGLDCDDRPIQVNVPLDMIGEEGWHDVIIRYNGVKLDLFIDGVLVDEEWPMGSIISGNSHPCLIGADISEGKINSGFYGLIDHIVLWNRDLSDEEVFNLSGGKQATAIHERKMLGEEPSLKQYWKPRGHNVNAGDCMPFFYDGTFHLFYLYDRKHHRSKWGYGAHQWAHATTNDLINWKNHPLTIPITEESEGSICTGSVLFHQGTYYAYYATRIPEKGECLSLATSINGIHFTKTQPNPFATPEPPYRKGPFRDPAIFQDEGGLFHLLVTSELEVPDLTGRGGCLAHL